MVATAEKLATEPEQGTTKPASNAKVVPMIYDPETGTKVPLDVLKTRKAAQAAGPAGAATRPSKGDASRKARTAPKPKAAKVARKPRGEWKPACRYCGSKDLAPSFIKRHDARCRKCFSDRYGSKAKGRKTKAAKK